MSRSPELQVLEAQVVALTHDGRGVVRVQNKVYFIDYTLPGDFILFQPGRKRRSYQTGKLIRIVKPSMQRVQPPCEYFGICGGCALQHMEMGAQIESKHQLLVDNLTRIGGVTPERYFSPLTGDNWGYRRKARLGIRYVPKKGGVLVGFRERSKSYITQLNHCKILHSDVARLLPDLQHVVSELSCFDQVPQIEVAVADNATVLVFRHLAPLSQTDIRHLSGFAGTHGVQVWLQSGGIDTVTPLEPQDPEPLHYTLDNYGLKIEFKATDFVQVNRDINQKLIDVTLEYLDLRPNEFVLDWFCGVGNFTLPMARRAKRVLGMEGDLGLVHRARRNARLNSMENVTFEQVDLFSDTLSFDQQFDKILLDPPRSGAEAAIKLLPMVNPKRIVYVSCNPATLARDAEFLVKSLGYNFTGAGIVNMFPHTTHVESIAVFEK